MELDKRIKEGKKPLTCFDTEQAKQFLGKECYFSDQLCTFNQLLDAYSYVTVDMLVSKEKHLYVGELLTVSDSDGSCYEAGINGEAEWFQFCLPCEWVKEPEKKWRAYTIAEFQETFTVGRAVRFRRKDAPAKEHLLAFGGYYTLHDGRVSILFGIHLYTLEELFEQYEWQEFYTDEYRPFGIEE